MFARITQNLAARDWSISVTPIFSVGFGTIGEYVYIKDVSGTNKKISELDWDVKPSLQYGGRVGVSWKALAVSGFAFGAVPMRSGAMKDSDWDENGIKNIFSVHENALASSYSFGGRIAYTFKPLDFFRSVLLSERIMYIFRWKLETAARGTEEMQAFRGMILPQSNTRRWVSII